MNNSQLSSDGAKNVYKVIAGSFRSRENADSRLLLLQTKGIEAFVHAVTISNEKMYRVQAGVFSIRGNADKRLEEVILAGIKDAFIVAEATSDRQNPVQVSIMGGILLTPEQLDLFVQEINPQAPEIGKYYISYGTDYGISGDIAFAQAILETDYFRFTGVVQPYQNNFSGLGSTGPDDPGAIFKTPSDGVLAHIQHLFAYASKSPLPNQYPLVDPRFYLVKRGSAQAWVDLNGKWAVPGENYGQTILNIYKRMLNKSNASK
ncbi:SPOR domain-containing protein [Niallia oryzisoli]|uniref:SPOR domain-containing protein n=1 Tax=Niallia oryzisoli TaxID=1737571 RepID=UPI0037357D23